VSVENSGDIVATAASATGIEGATNSDNNLLAIVNSGDITTTGDLYSVGISAFTSGIGSPINIVNSGNVKAVGNSNYAIGVYAETIGPYSPIVIQQLRLGVRRSTRHQRL
jgi:hypothetical protein